MIRRFGPIFAFILATTCAARADNLAVSQNVILGAQMVNAYTISRYGWEGDRWYDQVVPGCGSHPGLVEFGCNAVVNVAIRIAEDAALRHASPATRNRVAVLNYIGAAAFMFYTRHAISVQIFGGR